MHLAWDKKSRIAKTKKPYSPAKKNKKSEITFTHKQAVEDFSVVVGYDEIKAKNYSLSAGQYFEVKIDYVDISADEFAQKMA